MKLSKDFFISFDGEKLALTSWENNKGSNDGPIIIGLHGMNDYADCYYLLAPYLAQLGMDFYAYDARGFGRNSNKGEWAGAKTMVRDFLALLDLLKIKHPNRKVFLIGDSMGAATILASFKFNIAPKCDGIILAAPAVWGWSNLPLFYRIGLWAGAGILKNKPLNPPDIVVRKIIASDNNEMLLKIGRDTNMIWETKPKTLKGLVDLMEYGYNGIENINPSIHPPILALFGAKDQIVPINASNKAKRKFTAKAKIIDYENGYHMLLRDLGREEVYNDIVQFIAEN